MLDKLRTEKRNENSMDLDERSTYDVLKLMNSEDHYVPSAIKQQLNHISKLVEQTIERMKKGGRLIYLGAGTSGRLGVLDAAECPPTFGVDTTLVIGLIAGGEKAFIHAVEGAEDSPSLGEADLKSISLNANDTVIGIAASGRTPYVIGGLQYANSVGSLTGSLACNVNAPISTEATHPIEVNTGSEILTGSTRLKAGTAQKLVLNMISTATMIGLGKVYKNLMVDLQPTNEKLALRSQRIIMEATDTDAMTASKKLEEANGSVKVAIIMILTGKSEPEAKESLEKANGFVKYAIQK
ncbi:N-acetylmuramic acid 6-phosphate etherase [Salipaludibacillus agaradhaerens]|uniref:N-acetylmuramic acid 6-phosphate etherase n=1 Tax=Salipaludibacillus agaradhaerens TaxID=76935 RepID=A0A9Q4B3N8_SALAG|nr:N-acetylmuramic acid 6-phosphate etherase [Salipaludibacillus agaradhaerens]MCR6097749.1 N-acetylmuramic acid 6-phosphate etherase [Salipaludibacillus agaradhaerens]MCR6112767.1 N-acetylmuramic acid 6-phosphate etherase [Salipaludibacillus agaradhaerens]